MRIRFSTRSNSMPNVKSQRFARALRHSRKGARKMHWMVLALFAAAVNVQAGVIQGVVLEHASGRPLARALVRLEPVPQAGGGEMKPIATRAGRSGHFAFGDI